MEKVKQYILGFAVVFSALILVLAVSTAITLNSGVLDLFVKDRLTDFFNREFRGKLSIEKLNLQFPSKVILHRAKLYPENEESPALSAKKLTVDLNFLRLLSNFSSITIRSLAADSLLFQVEHYPDNTTNIDRIFASRKEQASDATGLERFSCGSLRITNSSGQYLHFAAEKAGPERLVIDNIELHGKSVRYSHANISGTLSRLRFQLPRHNFTLREGSAKISLGSNHFEILDLRAKTAKSNVKLSVGFYDFNVFSLDENAQFSNSPASLFLQDVNLHTDDLALLFPGYALPEGVYKITGTAEGKLRMLDMQSIVITHQDNVLRFNGELVNLNQPEFFSYRVNTDSSRITGSFLQEALSPDTTLKKLAEPAGDISFSGALQGNLDELLSDLSLETAAGNLELSLQAEFENRNAPGYAGTLTLTDFALHRFLLEDTTAVSALNCTGEFSGKGFFSQSAETSLSLDLSNSFWQEQELTGGSVDLDYSGKVLETEWNLAGEGNAQLSFRGSIDWTGAAPAYSGKGSATGIDLSKSLGDGDIRSNLNFSLQFQGEEFDPDKLQGNLLVRFGKSTMNDYTFREGSELAFVVSRKGRSTETAIKSDFLDFTATGNYTFRDFLSGLELTTAAIERESTRNNIWKNAPPSPKQVQGTGRDFSADYRLVVRDISPLAIFFPLKEYALNASASGKSYRKNGDLYLTSELAIDSFTRKSSLDVKAASIEIDAAYNRDGILRASLDGAASELFFENRTIQKLSLEAIYDKNQLTTQVSFSAPDIQRSFNADVKAVRSNNLYAITVNDLTVTDPDGAWSVNKNARIDIGRNSTRFYGVTFGKQEQKISFDGLLSNTLPGNFTCSLENLDLRELDLFLEDNKFEGTVSSSLRISGSGGSKTAVLKLAGRELVYDDVMIGMLNLGASHKGERLKMEFSTDDNDSSTINDIRGEASLPLKINWSPLKVTVPDNRSVSAKCSSDNLSAEILEVMLPFFETAEGTIPAQLTVRGKTPKPDIYFKTELNNTEITVTPTETAYQLSGLIEITPTQASFKNILIKDGFGGTGKLSGSAGIEELEAKTVDLTASFDHLLLYNKKDKKDETSFGTITGTTENIHFCGDIGQPTLTGSLFINEANFTLYSSASNESSKYIGAENFIEFLPRYPAPADTAQTADAEPPENPEFYYSLIDILQIKDLRLESTAPLQYNMIFNRTRGEQLETTLRKLSVNINKQQQNYRLFGFVDIASGTYRFSNSSFDLEEGGRIVWNNVDIRSGVMENLFGKKYVNVTNAQTGESDNVNLLLAIQGTLNNPDIQMGYYLNDSSQPYALTHMIGNQSSKIDPNAEVNVISLLLTKQWYIRPGSQGGIENIPFSSVGISTGTGLISSRISQFLREAAGFESFNVNVGVDEKGELSGLDFSLAFLVPGTGGQVRFIGTGISSDVSQNSLFGYYRNRQQLEYRVTRKLFFEAYRSYGLFGSDVSTTNLLEPSDTYGVSLSYRERFYSWEEFWHRVFGGSDKDAGSEE